MPSPTHSKIPSGAPASATHFTFKKFRHRKFDPTENINSTTPISAITSKFCVSCTRGPGVSG